MQHAHILSRLIHVAGADRRLALRRSVPGGVFIREAAAVLCPDFGTAFTGWKLCRRSNDRGHSHWDNVLVELLIPADARRCVGAHPPECRAEWATVVSIAGGLSVAYSRFFHAPGARLKYVVGETVRPDSWGVSGDDPNAGGIYFCLSAAEAATM